MAHPNARRALYFLGLGALLLAAIIAASLGTRFSAMQGAAPSSASPPEPDWQQLMGRSVQARKAGAIHEDEQLLLKAVYLSAKFGPRDMLRAHTLLGQAEFHMWSDQPELAEQEY